MQIESFGNGYTVFYNGDEVYFDTHEQAENFIEEIEGGITMEKKLAVVVVGIEVTTLDEYETLFGLMKAVPEIAEYWKNHNLFNGKIFNNECYKIEVTKDITTVYLMGVSADDGRKARLYNRNFDMIAMSGWNK